jgi:hypothetical protein
MIPRIIRRLRCRQTPEPSSINPEKPIETATVKWPVKALAHIKRPSTNPTPTDPIQQPHE